MLCWAGGGGGGDGTCTTFAAALQLVHFKKEDERLLRQLLAKVKKQADAGDKGAAKATEVEQVKVRKGGAAPQVRLCCCPGVARNRQQGMRAQS